MTMYCTTDLRDLEEGRDTGANINHILSNMLLNCVFQGRQNTTCLNLIKTIRDAQSKSIMIDENAQKNLRKETTIILHTLEGQNAIHVTLHSQHRLNSRALMSQLMLNISLTLVNTFLKVDFEDIQTAKTEKDIHFHSLALPVLQRNNRHTSQTIDLFDALMQTNRKHSWLQIEQGQLVVLCSYESMMNRTQSIYKDYSYIQSMAMENTDPHPPNPTLSFSKFENACNSVTEKNTEEQFQDQPSAFGGSSTMTLTLAIRQDENDQTSVNQMYHPFNDNTKERMMMCSHSTQSITAKSTPSITAECTQSIPAECTQSITTESAQSIAAESTQSINAESTQSITTESTQSISTESTQYITAESTRSITKESTQSFAASITLTSVHSNTKWRLSSIHTPGDILDAVVRLILRFIGHCTTSGASTLLIMMLISFPFAAALNPLNDQCSPRLSVYQDNEIIKDLNLKIGASMELICNTALCSTIDRIVYEKIVDLSWIPVFDSVHGALDKKPHYSLNNRAEHGVMSEHSILVVKLLEVQDEGQWRCAVYDEVGNKYESNVLQIKVHATPADDAITIQPINPLLVTNQTVEFSCHCNNVYPDVDILLSVNNVEYGFGKPDNHRNKDGLWSLNNTFKFRLKNAGKLNITCEIKDKRTAKTLSKNSITFSVKDEPKVVFPTNDSLIKTTGHSPFLLYCNGSGYRPDIYWLRDDRPINPNEYIIESDCEHQNQSCYSSISPQPHGQQLSDIYTGSYTCVVHLQPPYQSSSVAISPEMRVYLLLPSDELSVREIFLLVLVGVLVLVIIAYATMKIREASGPTPPVKAFENGAQASMSLMLSNDCSTTVSYSSQSETVTIEQSD